MNVIFIFRVIKSNATMITFGLNIHGYFLRWCKDKGIFRQNQIFYHVLQHKNRLRNTISCIYWPKIGMIVAYFDFMQQIRPFIAQFS